MSEAAKVRYWQSMSFHDADTMMTWLGAIGFTEHATYRDEGGVVVHAEWLWPGGGGLMFGQVREEGLTAEPGRSSAYLVTDDPDGVVERAVTAGASVLRPVVDEDYGGRGGTIADPEGNRWSIGSYQPS